MHQSFFTKGKSKLVGRSTKVDYVEKDIFDKIMSDSENDGVCKESL